jgi:cytochrome c biogenesis protein CcmG, thiol:disulfide interchange protein DsbE
MRRALAPLVALAAAAVLAGCSGGGLGENTDQQLVPPPERDPAPKVDVPALDGDGRVTLASHRGTPVVLNFWASWCEPCQRETPELAAFSKRHPKIAVVGLAVNDIPSDAKKFAAKEGVPYELGLDRDADTADEYGVTGLPVTAVIDADGNLAATFIGEISEAQLESFARQLGG